MSSAHNAIKLRLSPAISYSTQLEWIRSIPLRASFVSSYIEHGYQMRLSPCKTALLLPVLESPLIFPGGLLATGRRESFQAIWPQFSRLWGRREIAGSLVWRHDRQTRCAPCVKSTRYVGCAVESKIVQRCGRET